MVEGGGLSIPGDAYITPPISSSTLLTPSTNGIGPAGVTWEPSQCALNHSDLPESTHKQSKPFKPASEGRLLSFGHNVM